MISLALARTLRDAGLRWDPEPGDRFVVVDREMDGEVFTLAEMTVDVEDVPTGRMLAFNGTAEWALDAVWAHDCVWLPGEAQLRERLAGTFRSLDRTDAGQWRVRVSVVERDAEFVDDSAAEAYGAALLHLVAG